MTEPLHISRVAIEPIGPLQRRATLATGESFEMGVHGGIAAHYRIDPPRPLPLPVDYIVAATGG